MQVKLHIVGQSLIISNDTVSESCRNSSIIFDLLGTNLSPISATFRIEVTKMFYHNQTAIFDAAVEFAPQLFLAQKLVALIVGAGIGVVLVVAAIVLGIFMYRKHKQANKDHWNSMYKKDSTEEENVNKLSEN